QPHAVLQELFAVDRAHRLECLRPTLALRGLLERLERLAEAARDDADEELLLRPEEPEDVRLRDACPGRDDLGRGSVQPVLGELEVRGVEYGLAPFRCRLALRSDCHR